MLDVYLHGGPASGRTVPASQVRGNTVLWAFHPEAKRAVGVVKLGSGWKVAVYERAPGGIVTSLDFYFVEVVEE